MTWMLGSGIEVKSLPPIFGDGKEHVFIDGVKISTHELLEAVLYVLTNTDIIGADDPKVRFVELVKKIESIPSSYNEGEKTLAIKDGSGKVYVSFDAARMFE